MHVYRIHLIRSTLSATSLYWTLPTELNGIYSSGPLGLMKGLHAWSPA